MGTWVSVSCLRATSAASLHHRKECAAEREQVPIVARCRLFCLVSCRTEAHAANGKRDLADSMERVRSCDEHQAPESHDGRKKRLGFTLRAVAFLKKACMKSNCHTSFARWCHAVALGIVAAVGNKEESNAIEITIFPHSSHRSRLEPFGTLGMLRPMLA